MEIKSTVKRIKSALSLKSGHVWRLRALYMAVVLALGYLFFMAYARTTIETTTSDVLTLSPEEQEYNLKKHMEIFSEEGLSVGVEGVLSEELFVSYHPTLVSSVNERHWLRLCLVNPTAEEIPLLIPTFFIDSVVVYQVNADGESQLLTTNNGYLVPPTKRDYPFYQTSVVQLKIPAEKSQCYLFETINKTKTGRGTVKSSFRMGFFAYTEEGFSDWYEWAEIFNSFMLGVLILVMTFNLALYVLGKENTYKYLLIYNLGFLLWVFCFGGMILLFGITENMRLERSIRLTPISVMVIGYTLFSHEFLDLKRTFPTASKILKALVLVYITSLITILAGYFELGMTLMQLSAPILYGTVILCSFLHYRLGHRLSVYFFAAAVLFTLTMVMYGVAYKTEEINYLYGHFGVQVFFLLDVLILVTITTKRYVNFKRQKVEAETIQNLLQIQLDHKNRQLTSHIALQMNQHKVLEEIQSRMARLKQSDNNLGQLCKDLSRLLNFESSWESFKLHFDEVHPDFFKKLKSDFEGLTDNEYRLSAFIKMGLKNKEIATVSGVSVRAVEKARERLKKKMRVDNLSAVLRAI